MIEEIKKKHRERLATASLRLYFLRIPTDEELAQWTDLLKNGMHFREFLNQIKQLNIVNPSLQRHIETSMQDMNYYAVDLSIKEHLSKKTHNIYMQLISAIYYNKNWSDN